MTDLSTKPVESGQFLEVPVGVSSSVERLLLLLARLVLRDAMNHLQSIIVRMDFTLANTATHRRGKEGEGCRWDGATGYERPSSPAVKVACFDPSELMDGSGQPVGLVDQLLVERSSLCNQMSIVHKVVLFTTHLDVEPTMH